MTVPQYKVILRNQDRTPIEILDVWSHLTFVKRFNDVGTWNLELPKTAKVAQYITPSTGIIVQRDNVTIFSGPAGYHPDSYVETKNTLKISGVDDNILLTTPCRPDPTGASPPYPTEYYVRTGVASTIMYNLVYEQIGPDAPNAWKVQNLTVATDPILGSELTIRGRFDPLLILLKELAVTSMAGGLGFEILQSDVIAGTLEFSIYEPEDKHTTTKFSTELKTAIDYEWTHNDPVYNYFFIAGGDDYGLNRTIIEGGDLDSIAEFGRRGKFVDKRGVTDTTELLQELAQQTASVVKTDVITITPTDTPSLKFGVDYDLGDYVSAIVNGVEYARIISEITMDFVPKQAVVIRPTIADPSITGDSILAQQLDTLQNRISNIERNYNVPDDSIIADMLHPTMKWYVGDLKLTARSASQDGWLLCNGTAISRTTYSALFLAIGTTFGVGDGSTTFNIPDMRDKFPIGVGATYNLGETGGSATVSLGSHTHAHSHSGNTLSFAHTHNSQAHDHPGSHTHGMKNHTHTTNIDHNHGAVDSGYTNIDSVVVGHASLGNGATDHKHSVDLPALGTTDKTSGNPNDNVSNSDSSAPSANYAGSPNGINGGASWSGVTSTDSTGDSGSTPSVLNPYLGVNYEIYTGVVI